MINKHLSLLAYVSFACFTGSLSTAARDITTFAINEYFGIRYEDEPVSDYVTFEPPARQSDIWLEPGPWQVEILEGTPEQVKKARIWTLVTFNAGDQPDPPERRHRLFTVKVGAAPKPDPDLVHVAVPDVERPIAILYNERFHCQVPWLAGRTEELRFDPAVSAFAVPAPLLSVSRDGREWIGSGYLDSISRIKRVHGRAESGPIFARSQLIYEFDDGKIYTADVRLFANKPYVTLVEDFNLGGASRFVFNYDDWFADAFFRTGDNKLYGWESITSDNPCGDFIEIEGQKALARMVIWSQFNYFAGKQETIALKQPDPVALLAAYEESLHQYEEQLQKNEAARAKYAAELDKYNKQLALYQQDSKKNKKPKEPKKPRLREPRKPEKPDFNETTYTLGGASIKATSVATPGGKTTAVGGFYIRPDRWTRAKVNHVDLYMRPEVPGDRMTRGIVGLKNARQRIAMEAWLVNGHREWAIFAVESGETHWLAKAHVVEGVWSLDRLNRTPLVWNSDGSPVAPEKTKPNGDPVGGTAASVLKNDRGRSGLQYFNGSNGHIRWRPPTSGWNGTVDKMVAGTGSNNRMVEQAIRVYMAADDSAYPSIRAMLPWTEPEAINPFYQGMENMNFNADLYRYIAGHTVPLLKLGHPEAKRFLDHAEKSLDMALSHYVYPDSGCWEESHGYASHTLGVVGPLAELLKNSGRKNFLDDVRLARMLEFFIYVHSPMDADFGMRIVPPVGDHGLNLSGPSKRFGEHIGLFTQSDDPEIKDIVARAAWMVQEDGGSVPEGVQPVKPKMDSRWLRGYGTVMRAVGEADQAESFLVLRAGQSWGHHHQDKGSMWFWGRDVHFFGDAAWGAPPGGTYWNEYKQGPASGTQIEFVGVNNWTLPCKYPAPWISDDEYASDFDYANARCLYPFNPDLDLSKSSPVAFENGYNRQVLFVKPDLLIVRDNVESMCDTIWRMHSYQVDGLKVRPGGAEMASPHGVMGQLTFVYPPDVTLQRIDRDDLNDHAYRGPDGKPTPYDQRPFFGAKKGKKGEKGRASSFDSRSVVLKWNMPKNHSATWVFGVHGQNEAAPLVTALDDQGRVTKVKLADGIEIIALLNIDPFEYQADGVQFTGTAGLIIKQQGRATTHLIRGKKLTAGK